MRWPERRLGDAPPPRCGRSSPGRARGGWAVDRVTGIASQGAVGGDRASRGRCARRNVAPEADSLAAARVVRGSGCPGTGPRPASVLRVAGSVGCTASFGGRAAGRAHHHPLQNLIIHCRIFHSNPAPSSPGQATAMVCQHRYIDHASEP